MITDAMQTVRHAARTLGRNPAFTLVAVITLALGLGGNAAIFSAVYALLLRPLPYADPARLVLLSERDRDGDRSSISYPNYSDWRERARSFEGMASVRRQSFNLTGVDHPAQLRGRTVDWNFLQLLGVQPQRGRPFRRDDDRYGAPRTALISDGMWRERFGGGANAVGATLRLDGEPYEVIGVLPPGFEYFGTAEVYVPIGLVLKPQSGMTDRASSFGLNAIARLKPGVTLAQASRELAGIAAQLEREYPAVNAGKSAIAEPLKDVMSAGVRQSLWVLLGAVGFILLIACVNVANLMLVRTADRQKEIALRLALGAGRGRVVRQLLTESLLIAGLGGAFGLVIGRWMLAGLLVLAPADIPHLSRVSLNVPVLLFTLGAAMLTCVLCGWLPAVHATRADLHTTLKEGGRATAGAARDMTRRALLIAEVSLAMVLLIGAGLLVRSMVHVLAVDPGFSADHLLTMRVMLPNAPYDPSRNRVFYEESVTRLSALPGVRSAALTISLPIDGSYWDSPILAADQPVPARADVPQAALVPVSTGYFGTMGIRVMKGRTFTAADATARAVVINESLARRFWPGENAVGKRMKYGNADTQSPWREVIGVVADVKLNGVESVTPLQAYLPLTQEAWSNFSIVVRTTGDPLLERTRVEEAIHSIDKDLPVFAIRSMDQLMGGAMQQRRLTLTVLVSFAVMALLLASVGIYGVFSHVVRQRKREFGIRLALGAQRPDVVRLVLTQGLKVASTGIGIGLLGALALTRWMQTLLFGVRPTDPSIYAGIGLVLLFVALLASWLPARRAAAVDPLVALRSE